MTRVEVPEPLRTARVYKKSCGARACLVSGRFKEAPTTPQEGSVLNMSSTYTATCPRQKAPMPRCTMPGVMAERSYGKPVASVVAERRAPRAVSVNFDQRLDQSRLLGCPDGDVVYRFRQAGTVGDKAIDGHVPAANARNNPPEVFVGGVAATE